MHERLKLRIFNYGNPSLFIDLAAGLLLVLFCIHWLKFNTSGMKWNGNAFWTCITGVCEKLVLFYWPSCKWAEALGALESAADSEHVLARLNTGC